MLPGKVGWPFQDLPRDCGTISNFLRLHWVLKRAPRVKPTFGYKNQGLNTSKT